MILIHNFKEHTNNVTAILICIKETLMNKLISNRIYNKIAVFERIRSIIQLIYYRHFGVIFGKCGNKHNKRSGNNFD